MMGVKLLEGRLITDRDTRNAAPVVLVNETMARTVWAGQSAIGRCIRAGHGPSLGGADPMTMTAYLPCREVVGVVRDSRARSLRTEGGEASLMQYYVPFEQLPAPPLENHSAVHAILVQTSAEPERLAADVQRLIQTTSPVSVRARVLPYQNLLDPQLRSWRLGASLFTALGALALAIASVGLYAVIAYVVSQRRREIGVRFAMGATPPMVARRILREAVTVAGAGALLGTAIAIVFAPMVQTLLFQTAARDAVSIATAVACVLAVTCVAALVPAFRAGRVNPIVVLRAEN
jgi:hypothetical protein